MSNAVSTFFLNASIYAHHCVGEAEYHSVAKMSEIFGHESNLETTRKVKLAGFCTLLGYGVFASDTGAIIGGGFGLGEEVVSLCAHNDTNQCNSSLHSKEPS